MTAIPEDYVYEPEPDDILDTADDYPRKRVGTCCECGWPCGTHAQGCPEDDRDEDNDVEEANK